MIPGELQAAAGELELNAGRERVVVRVRNTGDRPIQVGSHFPFADVNDALEFDRAAAGGFRLDEPAGTVFAARGHVETLIPPQGDIHTVTAAGRDLAISIHVYGADIEQRGTSIDRRYDDLPVVRRDRSA